MLKFNNDHIITGYIKQLLASFNLPSYKVYTIEDQQYLEEHGHEAPWIIRTIPEANNLIYPGTAINSTSTGGSSNELVVEQTTYVNYIKNNSIQRLVLNSDGSSEQWQAVPALHYHYNKKELNQTKNLKIINNSYDEHTHKYLGEFLRFQRDYNNINLMSMYNCFSNELCPKLYLHVYTKAGRKVTFDTDDTNYKIYMLPVKLFEDYTIAIDCSGPVEVFCGFFDKYYDNRTTLENMPILTYKKFNCPKFNKPFIYSKLSDLYNTENISSSEELLNHYKDLREFAQNECNLKMFIRVPFANSSSITILEGDYRINNDTLLSNATLGTDGTYKFSGVLKQHNAHTVLNFESGKMQFNLEPGWTKETALGWNDKPGVQSIYSGIESADKYFKPTAPCELLRANTGISYPIADRLIEYLTSNAITHIDENSDNVLRTQKVVTENTGVNFEFDGLWDNKLRAILYTYMMSEHANIGKFNFDIIKDTLGYVDKDVEKNYASWIRTIAIGSNGKPLQKFHYEYNEETGQQEKVFEYEPLAMQLGSTDSDILLSAEGYYLYATEEDTSENRVPVYQTKATALHTIANIDLYEDMYPQE